MVIMPPENVAPKSTPRLAIIITVLKLATREPKAPLKKLTASLLTPTNKSEQANKSRKTRIKR